MKGRPARISGSVDTFEHITSAEELLSKKIPQTKNIVYLPIMLRIHITCTYVIECKRYKYLLDHVNRLRKYAL